MQWAKKGGKWIFELPHVIWGLHTQRCKAMGQSPFFFLVYRSEAILPAIVMWQSSRVEMYQEAKTTKPEVGAIVSRRGQVQHCAICKVFGGTMTTIFMKGHSTSAIKSLVAFKMSRGCTRSTQGGKDHSSYFKLQDHDNIACSTLMVKRSPTRGTLSTFNGSTPSKTM